jgi:hypothetical protein
MRFISLEVSEWFTIISFLAQSKYSHRYQRVSNVIDAHPVIGWDTLQGIQIPH